ncbi:unnamed protein product [Onchocerca flexuosa]|uniref:Ribosomal_L14e domain-containing protein n=1 Tax=Onchocerca flexuosa TaxID=387005 RepID=A0A183HHR9_9BILA|nr:unnamed protein product [Onchocerca flexuosa]
MTDFDRFKLMRAKQLRNRLVRLQVAKLRNFNKCIKIRLWDRKNSELNLQTKFTVKVKDFFPMMEDRLTEKERTSIIVQLA